MDNKENMIEFISGQDMATVSFTNKRYITKMKKLHSLHKDAFDYYIENSDGSVCARIPLKWIKVGPPRKVEMTDEQRVAAAERLKSARKKIHESESL